MNKARLIERIADLVREKTIEGISDLRDESDRDGMRIVIELKRGEMPEVVLNNLYKHTPLQSSFGIIMLAIVGGRPKVMNLLELIETFVEFRREVVRRRTEFELRKAEARYHILEGLKIALDHLDAVITLIRGVEDRAGSPRRPDDAVRPVADPGAGHPRHAAAAPDRAGSATGELRHQPLTRLGHCFRAADQCDDRIEVIERNLQALEDVIAGLGLAQLELGAPAHDLAAEVDEALHQLEQGQHLRPAADDREHDDAEAQLQRRVLVEVVQHHLRHLAALQLDDDPHAVAIGLVAQVGNPLDRLFAHEVGDPLDQLRLVDLIGNLGDDDGRTVALLVGLDRRLARAS